MTANLLFALGTLLTWIGWGLAIRAVVLLCQWTTKAPGLDLTKLFRGLMLVGLGGFVCLSLGAMTPMASGAEAVKDQWRLPLVWLVMPWTAWLSAVGVLLIAIRLTQAALSISSEERMARLKAIGGWALAVAVFQYLYHADPGSKIEVLKGGISFPPSTWLAVALLAIAGTFAMVLAGRNAVTKGYAKTLAAQVALIAGSVVFGLPFAYLLITSFKEDRDMSSPTGIVWTPHVSETLPYFNPKDPLYAARYDSQYIEGSIIERHPDGTVKLDIQKPLAIRGATYTTSLANLKEIPREVPKVTGQFNGVTFIGRVVADLDDGHRKVEFTQPASLAGQQASFEPGDVQAVRHVGLRTMNYPDALDYLPVESHRGLVFLKNTLLIVVMSVIGTILSSSIVAYAFSRLKFPGREALFAVLLSTMMLPAAVTLMPQFLIFRSLGWIDTLYPIWVPAFFGSAFNVFLLRQFFMQIPMELEDAAKIDGCSYVRTFWDIMLPQIKPALAVIAIWTFMGAWNNFMGPLIYVSSPENLPLSYALQMFQGDRGGEPGLLMAFATLTIIPVLALFFFAQRYFIEGVTLSGLGGR